MEGSEVALDALHSFLRGGTFQALAREIAWRAVREADASEACLEWLTALVSRPLGDGLEGLEFEVDRACVRARAGHLRAWPYDAVGADLAARTAGEAEAAAVLARLYDDVLAWAAQLLDERLRAELGARRPRRAA